MIAVCEEVQTELKVISNLPANEKNEDLGNYVKDLQFQFLLNGQVVGKAYVQLTSEQWLSAEDSSLLKSIYRDFNDEINWNAAIFWEYLEDALLSVNFEGNPIYRQKFIAVIHRIEIIPEERGKGYAAQLLSLVLLYLQENMCQIVLLQPHPYGEKLSLSQKFQNKERLMAFYRRYGFESVPLSSDCSDKGTAYMRLFL